MKIMDILSALIVLFFLPYLSNEVDVRRDDASTLTLTITITTDTLDPIMGTITSTYTTTILSLIFTGLSDAQSPPVASMLTTNTSTTSTTVTSTTFNRLPSSTTMSSDISTSMVTSSTMAPSPTSSVTSTTPILVGGTSGDSEKSIPIAAIIGVSSGLGLAFVLAGIAFWMNRRQKKARAKNTPLTGRSTHNDGFSAMRLETVAQRRWGGPHGSSGTYWIDSKETEVQVAPMAGRKGPFRDRLDISRNGPCSTTNVSDEGYWTSSQQVRYYPRPPALRSTPRVGQETPSLSESENMRQQTDLAMRDLEAELDTLDRSRRAGGYGAHDDQATPRRRISPEDMAIQKFNELHAAYQLHPLTSRENSLPDLPSEKSDTIPWARLKRTSATQTKSAVDLRTARYRTQALQALEGRTYASSSDYSQDSLSETAESGEGVKSSKSLPNM